VPWAHAEIVCSGQGVLAKSSSETSSGGMLSVRAGRAAATCTCNKRLAGRGAFATQEAGSVVEHELGERCYYAIRLLHARGGLSGVPCA
jgi:hypothetical protein